MKVHLVFCSAQHFFFSSLMFLFLKVFLVLVQGTSLIQRLMSVAYTYDNLAPRYAFLCFLYMYIHFLSFILSWTCWHSPLVLVLWRQRQVDSSLWG
jgi:hypothetical protein